TSSALESLMCCSHFLFFLFFFFNDPAPTEIYTLSLHDALPISMAKASPHSVSARTQRPGFSIITVVSSLLAQPFVQHDEVEPTRSEEHTSELQSPCNLVCRLLLEKKKKIKTNTTKHYTENNNTI